MPFNGTLGITLGRYTHTQRCTPNPLWLRLTCLIWLRLGRSFWPRAPVQRRSPLPPWSMPSHVALPAAIWQHRCYCCSARVVRLPPGAFMVLCSRDPRASHPRRWALASRQSTLLHRLCAGRRRRCLSTTRNSISPLTQHVDASHCRRNNDATRSHGMAHANTKGACTPK